MLDDQRLAGSREDADAAFRSLYAEHGPTLLRLSTVLTEGDRHRVEDMVQETMLRAWKHRANLDIEHRSPRAWHDGSAPGCRRHRARQTRPPEAALDDHRAASVLHGPDALTALLDQARESSGMDSVILLERKVRALLAGGRVPIGSAHGRRRSSGAG
jgi:DNA-directed RNA polymerase specialized sigma24 family protein